MKPNLQLYNFFYIPILILIITATVIAPNNCWGKTVIETKGAFRLNYNESNKYFDDVENFYGATFEIESNIKFNRQWVVKIDGRLGDEDIPRSGGDNSELIQAFLQYRSYDYDITLGRQIIAWGKADAVNPTDIVSPRNYNTSLPYDDDQRLGVDALKVDYHFESELSLSLALIYKNKPSELFFPSEPDTQYRVNTENNVSFRKPNVAFKLSKYSGYLDWSVYYYNGFSLLPESYYFEENTSFNSLFFRYPKLSMYGFDFAGVIDRFGYRVEYASYHPKTNSVDSKLISHDYGMKPYDAIVIGVDRTFFEYLNINFQYIARKRQQESHDELLDKSSRSIMTIQQLNRFIYMYPKKFNQGITFKVSNQWLNEKLFAEIFINHHFVDHSSFYQIEIKYDIQDGLNTSLGLRKYRGKPNSLFGILKENGNIYFELKHSF